MALKATAHHWGNNLTEDLQEICHLSNSQSGLTPRSLATLRKLANKGDLILLRDNGNLAGWGVREQLVPGLKEVGLMFIKPEFRTPSAFAELTRELDNDPSALLFASYDPALIRFVIAKHNFRQVSLGEVALRSWGRFVTKRLSKSARTAVRQHTREAKPLFAIRSGK